MELGLGMKQPCLQRYLQSIQHGRFHKYRSEKTLSQANAVVQKRYRRNGCWSKPVGPCEIACRLEDMGDDFPEAIRSEKFSGSSWIDDEPVKLDASYSGVVVRWLRHGKHSKETLAKAGADDVTWHRSW